MARTLATSEFRAGLMEKIMSKTNDAVTSEQVLEPSRELTEDELAQVSGGIIAILIGMLTPSIPIPPPASNVTVNGGPLGFVAPRLARS